KAHGSLVVVAHYPATRTAMERAGLLSHLPTVEQLVEAQVDGFEVANRSPATRPQDQELYARISALCEERGLLRLAVSDDHGIPAGSPCITMIDGELPGDQAAARAFVEGALRERRGIHPVIFPDRPRPVVDPPILDVLFWCHRYLGSLTLLGRLSWLLWGTIVYLVLRPRRPRGSTV
ncbi:MAG TPA: hypothetical protein PKA37_16485, partial [Planctomycetota bacterium]|nr:hypothetical protein [Planctomycetota bacterium]